MWLTVMEADGVVAWVVGNSEVEDTDTRVQGRQNGRLLAAEVLSSWDPEERESVKGYDAWKLGITHGPV